MTNIFTTTIFYANGEPHLGHVYSGILADIFNRYSLLADSESCLITGCLLYTTDAAAELSFFALGGSRILYKQRSTK